MLAKKTAGFPLESTKSRFTVSTGAPGVTRSCFASTPLATTASICWYSFLQR